MAIFEIHIHGDFAETNKQLKKLNLKIDNVMATLAELSAKVDELQTALDEEQAQIAQAIADLQQAVTDLQGQITDGGTAEERQAVLDKLNATIADLKETIPGDVVIPPPSEPEA